MMHADVFSTDKNCKMQKSFVVFETDYDAESNLIKIYPDIEFQNIAGFGGAFTEAAGYVYSQMGDAEKEKFLKLYFDENRYSLGRLPIQSCDFALDNYCYIKDENDIGLNSFSLERDEKYIIPLVQDALKINPDLKFIASPWSPPAFMKTNDDMNHGGKLKKEYYQMWADVIAKYIFCCRRDYGIYIDRLTVQNEPYAQQTWDSCIFTAAEEADFACNYLRKSLDNLKLDDVKIFCHDHNKDKVIDRVKGVFSFENAVNTFDGIAFHWYSGDHFDALDYLSKTYPDKELFFTEGCVEYSCCGDKSSFENAQRYVHDLIGDFANGTNAMTDWNLLLNEQGGPNHVGNFCESPLMYDTLSKKLIINDSYYAIGHFSRFVKTGAKVILSSVFGEIEAVAFKNPDGCLVCVILNKENIQVDYVIRIGNMTGRFFITARSIQTIIIYDV